MKETTSIYNSPEIQEVLLDKEISMVLYSLPPDGPGDEMNQQAPYFFDEDDWDL